MKRVIKTVINSSDDIEDEEIVQNGTWYRCVEKGSDVLRYHLYELGIHCGTEELAEYIKNKKYEGSGDIYKISLDSSVKYSKPVPDFEVWNSIEAISEILSEGFGVDISRVDVTEDFRNGNSNRNNAAEYIVSKVGYDKLVVMYNNKVETSEQDIIILDNSCIKSYMLL